MEHFKNIYNKIGIKGKSRDSMISACLFLACRQEGVSRTFKGLYTYMYTFYCDVISVCKLYVYRSIYL